MQIVSGKDSQMNGKALSGTNIYWCSVCCSLDAGQQTRSVRAMRSVLELKIRSVQACGRDLPVTWMSHSYHTIQRNQKGQLADRAECPWLGSVIF